MHLEETRDWRALGEIPQRGADSLLSRLAFDGEEGLAIPQDDELDFPPVGVPQVAKLHHMSLGVLDPVAVLEELGRHQVLESRALVNTPDQSQR